MRTLTSRFFISLLVATAGSALAQQVCPVGHTLNAPNSRYAVQTDASQVKDSKTALVWQRCSLGQTWSGSTCMGAAAVMTWAAAQITAAAIAGSSGGFAWRVPNIKELASLPELACQTPAINSIMFPETPIGGHWSSSSLEGYLAYAWRVSFDVGGDGGVLKGNNLYVRLVRSSQ